jgi:DNA-binding beta-propeller fold protein YncE
MDRRTFVVAAAGLVLAPRAFARRFGGTPLALVTADLEARIVAVSLATGTLLRSIPTTRGPRSIQPVGRKVVVAHTSLGAVSLVDGGRLEVDGVLHDFDEPRYTASALDGRYAFVTDSGSRTLVVVDALRGRVVRRLAVGGPARHISVDRGGRRLWIALGTKAPRIAVVDIADAVRPRLLGAIKPPFLAHDVGFARDRVWVTSGDRHAIALFDPRTARTVNRLDAGSPPQHVTFSGELAFVTSGDDGTLTTHDARTGRVLGSARIPTGSYNVQEGGGVILTPSLSQGTLCIVDRRGRVRRSVRVARSSHDACHVVSG